MPWHDQQDAMHKICMDVFGTPATYGRGAVSISFKPVYDNSYVEVDPNTGIAVSTTSPMIGVRLADLKELGEPMRGDVVKIDGRTYQVVDSQPDSEGGADLILQEEDGS